MADYSDPKRATAYRFTLSLFARSDNQIKTAPTLAAGDVKVSKDNGATANITTLPSEAPASSGILQVDLSATEMTADLVTVIFRDAAGAEWNDVAVNIAPGVRQMADLAFPNTSGRGMDVDANGGVEVGSFQAGAITAAAFTAGAIDASSIAADAITDAKVASDVTIASVTGAVGSVTGAVGSVTGNVGGNVVGSVASVTAGVTLAASAVQAIWDALTSALTTVGSVGKLMVDNINATVSSRLASASYTAPLDAAGTRAAVGLASANLDTQLADLPTNAELATALGTADDAVLTQVALVKAKTDLIPASPAATGDIPTADITAIKAKTDSLAFTLAGKVDANIEAVNGAAITGTGSTADPWGP